MLLATLFSVYLICSFKDFHLIRLRGTLLIQLFLLRYHLLTTWEAKVEDHLFKLSYGIENNLFSKCLMKVYLHQTTHKFCRVLHWQSKIIFFINLYIQKTDPCHLQTLMDQALRNWEDLWHITKKPVVLVLSPVGLHKECSEWLL